MPSLKTSPPSIRHGLGLSLIALGFEAELIMEETMRAWALEKSKKAFLEMFGSWGELTGVRATVNGRSAKITIGTAIEETDQILVRGANNDWSTLIVRDGGKLVPVLHASDLRRIARKRKKGT